MKPNAVDSSRRELSLPLLRQHAPMASDEARANFKFLKFENLNFKYLWNLKSDLKTDGTIGFLVTKYIFLAYLEVTLTNLVSWHSNIRI